MFRTTTFFIDEKILQRMLRRQEQDERNHGRMRPAASRFRHAFTVDGHETFPPSAHPQAS
jgi:hypothetical protein